MSSYQPRLDPDRRQRIIGGMARINDFWKAIDHRVERDAAPLQFTLEKRDISYHWLEMACRFTTMELDEVRLEITRSYGDKAGDLSFQPLDRNTSQAILSGRNLFHSASSSVRRYGCPQFDEKITYENLRRQLQEMLDSINRKVQIYTEANSVAAPQK
jgi:hypothetical protein